MGDLYQVLEVNYSASTKEIKLAFRSLAKKYHPDINKAENATEMFQAILEAYEILSDSKKRNRYDRTKDSPSPKKAPKARSNVYEQTVNREREKARDRASYYSHRKFEEFDSYYFKNASAFLLPKLLGCLGYGILCFSIGFFLIYQVVINMGKSGTIIVVVILLAMIAFAAYFSTKFDVNHNQRAKNKKQANVGKRSRRR